jgi:2-polyprenyl-3-methyl-5-hydroxy-6-metoxy-1,4-benzoquinol methylase
MTAQAQLPAPLKSAPGLADLSRRLYAGMHWRWRVVQPLRPYICPFGEVIDLVPPHSRVLDVGCGSGLFLLFLASFDKLDRGVGFDVAKEAIETAQLAAAKLADPSRLQFSVRSVEEGIPQGDWSVVSVIDVIHHIPPPFQAGFIRDLCAATPPGARLIIKDMVARPRWRAFANRMHDLLMAKQWVHHAGPETVESWVTDPDMVCVQRSRSNMLWYGHWTLVFERRKPA